MGFLILIKTQNDKYNSKIHNKFRVITDSEEILEEPYPCHLLPELRKISFLLSSSQSMRITELIFISVFKMGCLKKIMRFFFSLRGGEKVRLPEIIRADKIQDTGLKK